jgi:hypothetical protein
MRRMEYHEPVQSFSDSNGKEPKKLQVSFAPQFLEFSLGTSQGLGSRKPLHVLYLMAANYT